MARAQREPREEGADGHQVGLSPIQELRLSLPMDQDWDKAALPGVRVGENMERCSSTHTELTEGERRAGKALTGDRGLKLYHRAGIYGAVIHCSVRAVLC